MKSVEQHNGHKRQQLILASSSPYRKELLHRLGLPFITITPQADETPLPGESPEALVARLASAKAHAVAHQHPDALIIGSDQVAVLEDQILGKPGNHDNAVAQLSNASGKRVEFLTGLCLLNGATRRMQVNVIPFAVVFRVLSAAQIDNYLRREQPYNCAGSFKSEGLGIALFDKLEGEDPTALVGLPLISLVQMLEHEGVRVI
ncbi:MAG: septum formation inhibitor Maf [Gammaproteobacteria bacterium]|nr:septum formation inhibitor Maf [Gammaproteobacteria bacterium]